jgi:hypothetical protein
MVLVTDKSFIYHCYTYASYEARGLVELVENSSKTGRKLIENWSKTDRKLVKNSSKTRRKLIENWSKTGRITGRKLIEKLVEN